MPAEQYQQHAEHRRKQNAADPHGRQHPPPGPADHPGELEHDQRRQRESPQVLTAVPDPRRSRSQSVRPEGDYHRISVTTLDILTL